MTASPADDSAEAERRPASPITIGAVTIAPGERKRFEIPVARLPTQTFLSLPVSVVHGRHAGPRLWLNSTIHGDELNGIEIIRRVLEALPKKTLRGTVIAVPIVNVFGFLNQSRALPDGRDLNRSFPGSARGSLASRVAHLLTEEIIGHCTHGIDFHTATNHRDNLPQVRCDLDHDESRRIAEAFAAPVVLHSRLRDGSLRAHAGKRGVAVLVFEGGESQRFNESVIEAGVAGTMRVLAALGMIKPVEAPIGTPLLARRSSWIRARRGGILRITCRLGDPVEPGQELGRISDVFGSDSLRVKARAAGVVIGLNRNPAIHQGDALVHVARTEPLATAAADLLPNKP